MYLLFLIAFLQAGDPATKPILDSVYKTETDCEIRAQSLRKEYAEMLASPAYSAVGAQFACLKVLGNV